MILRLLFTLIFTATSLQPVAFASTESQKPTNAIHELQLLLLEPVPLFHGSNDFFQEFMRKRAPLPFGLKPEDLMAHATFGPVISKGANFRKDYFELLNKYLSQGLSFQLNPEISAIAFIQNLRINQKTIHTEGPLPDLEIRARALRQALVHNGLPPSWGWSDLERAARSLPNARSALDEYKRNDFQLRIKEFDVRRPKEPTPQEVKLQLSHMLARYRIENFKAQLQVYDYIADEPLHLQFSKGSGTPLSLNLHQLSESDLRFIKNASITHRFASETSSGPKHVRDQKWRMNDLWKTKDAELSDDFYDVPTPVPPTTKMHVQITTKAAGVLTISEADFVLILNRLNAGTALGEDLKLIPIKRFLIEGAARDQQLAQLDASLAEMQDPNLKFLIERLETRNQRLMNTPSWGYETLTNNLRDSKFRFNDSVMAQLYWAGITLSPDYWSQRDKVADLMKRPYWNDGVAPKLNKKEQKKLDKQEEKMKRMAAHRLLDEDGKRRDIGRYYSRIFLITMALLTGIPAGAYSAWHTVEQIHINWPHIERVSSYWLDSALYWLKQQIPELPFELPKFPMLPLNDEDPIFDPNQPLSITNVDQTGDGDRTGDGSRKINNAFIITELDENMTQPRHFNLLTRWNVPEEILQDTDVYSEPMEYATELQAPSTERFLKANEEWPRMTVESRLRTGLIGNRLPIVSFDKSLSLMAITLYRDGVEIPRDQYKVYSIRGNNMLYAEVSSEYYNSLSKINYRAIFSFGRGDQPIRLFDNLDTKILRGLNRELADAGFTALGLELENLMRDRPVVGAQEIAEAFNRASVYTYKGGPSIRFDWDMEFSDFTDFLKDGVIYAQCTSNFILSLYLHKYYNAYAEYNSYAPYVRVEPLISFPVDDETGRSTTPGHQRTQLAYNNTENYSSAFKIIDGTPGLMEYQQYPNKFRAKPRPPEPEPLENPSKKTERQETPKEHPWRHLLPTIPEGPRLRERAEVYRKEKDEPKKTEEEKKQVDPDMSYEEVRARMTHLQELKKKHIAIFQGFDSEFITMNLARLDRSRLAPENIPGLAPARLVTVLQDYLDGRGDIRSAIAEILMAIERWPSTREFRSSINLEYLKAADELLAVQGDSAFFETFERYLEIMNKETRSLEEKATDRRIDPKTYGYKLYLLDASLQQVFNEMLTLMRDTNWPRGVIRKAETCESSVAN